MGHESQEFPLNEFVLLHSHGQQGNTYVNDFKTESSQPSFATCDTYSMNKWNTLKEYFSKEKFKDHLSYHKQEEL